MTFNEYKKQCINYIKKSDRIQPYSKKIIIEHLEGKRKKTCNDTLYNYCIELAIQLYSKKEISEKEYSGIYSQMSLYF